MAKPKKNKQIHPNNKTLASLIQKHGMDKVVAATAYKPSTLIQYSNGNVGVIPTARLEIALKLLPL